MRLRWIVTLILTLLGVGFWAATMFIAYRDWGFICENTGSRMSYREWFFGARTSEQYHASALEVFLRKEYPEKVQHRWTSYRGTGRSLIPGVVLRGHGSPGPILDLGQEMFDAYVNSLSSKQRLDLYDELCRGDEDVIQERIVQIRRFSLSDRSSEHR